MLLVDLHTHTTASDGTDSPTRLVEKAHAAGLATLAVTDHDTVSGLEAAEQAGQRLGLTVVRGCELSSATDQGEMHILGLWLPRSLEPLEEQLVYLRRMRHERNSRMVDKLRALGLDISMDDVLQAAGGESVGRPHIAAAMLAKGLVRDWNSAFQDYLGCHGKAYLPKEMLPATEAVRLLASLGATVCLAHPLLRKSPPGWIEDFISQLVPHGLSAIEVYHSNHSQQDCRRCLGLARRFDLGMSGGSDYHGDNKPGLRLGVGYGGLRVSLDVLHALEARRTQAVAAQAPASGTVWQA